jgi:acyl dehydratase
MKTFAAILRDPNPIHWDRDEVSAKGFGDRLINQGPINLGYILNGLMAWAGPDSIRRIRVRFASNVLEGDRVEAAGEVTGIREIDGVKVADCNIWLTRQDGERALVGTASVTLPD